MVSAPAVSRHRAAGRVGNVLLAAMAAAAVAAAAAVLRLGLGSPPAGIGWLTAAVPSGSASSAAAAPSRVRIPAIAVDAAIGPLHRDRAGRLAAPRSYHEAGWYAEGPVPGSPGPAVLAGHVDSTQGAAVFHGLRRLHPGDRVEVLVGGAWVAFRVTGVRRVPKAEFPTAAVYGPTPDPQLRLITCGGDFDRSVRSYIDNVVVFATAG